MSLIRLIVCTCGHCVDRHDGSGCCGPTKARGCACPVPRDRVLDVLVAVEREEIRRQWMPDSVAGAS